MRTSDAVGPLEELNADLADRYANFELADESGGEWKIELNHLQTSDRLVLCCIEADFFKQILIGIRIEFEKEIEKKGDMDEKVHQ